METIVIDNFGLILVIVPVLLLKRHCYVSGKYFIHLTF